MGRSAEVRSPEGRSGAVGPGEAPPVGDEGLPEWLSTLAEAVAGVRPEQLSRFLPPPGGGRQSAVLVLFGDAATAVQPSGPSASGVPAVSSAAAGSAGGPAPVEPEPYLLLMERASSLRAHAGQPSFPGGALDPEDGDPQGAGPLRAALREAEEETGLDPSGVQIFSVLPKLYIPVSDFVVTPVLGWWREPSPVAAVDAGETARVFTVPLAELTDPANRGVAVHPSGYRGACFQVHGALVWGFTAGVIDRILHHGGWERPWDRERSIPLDWHS
ncbi:CoA pyrophosphatase [Streptomyces sp. P38-E01]|uniref:CoA pyrophosphatase n=1 Tax=Streptomyces tardus TaxID=2780544 RepID=A0A949N3V8_9ACTN|nr:CoA pyrophosphatase [Streptomyces tardus]